jgi:nanoRNase/pAp phosphatase (c-di-AMP/oligoRNAs hydrolase)
MISDATELDASARSAHRKVYRWGDKGAKAEPMSNEEARFCGDPTQAETYGWVRDARAVTAVVHLRDDARAAAAVDALRAVRADAAIMVLSEALDDAPGDGTLVRAGELRDVLRLDLEDELVRLESERRSWCLRQFVEGCEVVPILVHPDPDPDALSSALAIRTLLRRDGRTAPIVTTLLMRRPENRRMAELLEMTVEEMTLEQLSGFDRLIVADMQPSQLPAGGPTLAVLDHHPAESGYTAHYVDVRPEYGAVATMVTEYLRSVDDDLITAQLATALLYGIRTDTDSLTRGVSAADVNAYAFLQSRADAVLLRRIQRPSYPVGAARAFGDALHGLYCENGLAVVHAGALTHDESHILADLADFCMEIRNVTRAAASAVVDDHLVITLRDLGGGDGVAGIARRLGERGGNGGGHATMARAVIPLAQVPEWRDGSEVDVVRGMVEEATTDGESVVDGNAEVVGGAAL